MKARSKAGWLFLAAALLFTFPYLIVFGIGSVWMWRHGLIWLWAVGAGAPTLLGLTLMEWARRLIFPPARSLPHPPPTSTPAGIAAMQAIREISERLQAEDPPLDDPDELEKVAHDVLLEVLAAVARQYNPQADRPIFQVPIVHIAALVELVARDFRQTFSDNVPGGKTVTPDHLLWWKKKGELAWKIGLYLWHINRAWRLCVRPATAVVQEVQDRLGQNMTAKSLGGLKQWAIDYCVVKAGDYAIQLYSGGFVLDDEYRTRISAPTEGVTFDQEPLQMLVVGQVKSGKSSLINALLGEMQAPVDALPVTDDVDLYECQAHGLPRIILRDTPGYGADDDQRDLFSRLRNEIEECDLLLVVCTARSAARRADRELLRKIHALYQSDPKRTQPPIVHVLTHIDTVPEHLIAEARDAVAADFGVPAWQIAVVCTEWGRSANLGDLLAAIYAQLPEAERLKTSRCIRQIRKEQDEDKILRQILGGLRLTGGWIVKKK
jgi:uncharacterized protein